MSTPLERVRPGDIISAADWNLLVDSINDAMLRILALESGGVGGSDLAIEQIFPPGPYRIGDTLQIVGRNFQFFVGATRVFFNATQALTLSSTSTDTQLELTIPTVPGVLESGTTVELTVSNQSQSTTRQIVLRPRLNPLQGTVTVEWLSASPSTILAGQAATFVYRVRSGANNAATWELTPAVQVAANAAAWNAQLRILDMQNNVLDPRSIALLPGQQIEVQVQIQTVPAGTNGTVFGVSLAANAGTIGANSGLRSFTVGSPVPPSDQTIGLLAVANQSPGFDAATNTITVPAGQSRALVVRATFTVAGTYAIAPTVVNNAAGWSIGFDEGSTASEVVTTAHIAAAPNGQVSRFLNFSVAASASAADTGQVQIRVQRQGASAAQTMILNVKR
jgi:IPT/TIG domain